MRELAFRLRPKSQHKIADYAKEAEEREVALIREHPKLLLILAFSFVFGFGFLFAVVYFVLAWLRSRRSPG